MKPLPEWMIAAVEMNSSPGVPSQPASSQRLAFSQNGEQHSNRVGRHNADVSALAARTGRVHVKRKKRGGI